MKNKCFRGVVKCGLVLLLMQWCMGTQTMGQCNLGPPPFGTYLYDETIDSAQLKIVMDIDSSIAIVDFYNRRVIFRIVNDSVFISDNPSMTLLYRIHHIEVAGHTWYRKSGFNAYWKRILSYRYGPVTAGSPPVLERMKMVNGKHVIITRYKKGLLDGVSSERVGTNYWKRIHYKNGLLNGKAVYDLPTKKGKQWFRDGVVVKSRKMKILEPTHMQFECEWEW